MPTTTVLGFVGVLAEQGVQPGHALEALGDPARGQHLSLAVEHAHVVVRLGPVDADEDHRALLLQLSEPQEAVAAS